MSQKILYIDMDNVLVDFPTGISRISVALQEQYADHLDDVPGIFGLMDPIEDAVNAYGELSAVFDTYILSTAPWDNPSAWSDKLLWVKRHLGDFAYKRLILSHHKLMTGLKMAPTDSRASTFTLAPQSFPTGRQLFNT